MEVTPCGHTSWLLKSLNLQRERAMFCDCVVRQKQSPGQLYPAHRCVLAASSPVLESVLSRTGVLVELQAPCLSGPVLALLLDYIYTGALPCTCTQQQYCSLLSAACYLQMQKLQEALSAWQQTEASDAGKASTFTENESRPHERTAGSRSETAPMFNKHLPLTCSIEKTDARAARSTADANVRGGEDAHASNGGNANNGGRASDSTLRNISSTAEGYSVSRVHKDPQQDRFHPAGIIKPGTWQNNTDEEMEGTDEGASTSSLPSSSSSSSSSSPHPCCGAVPVICHSGRASMLQQVSTGPAYLTQASVDCSRAAASRPASAEREFVSENITTEHKERPESEGLSHRNNENQTGTEDSSHQRAAQSLFYQCRRDQADTIIQESALNNTDDDDDDVSKSAAAEERSQDLSLPVETLEAGGDSYRPKREAKEKRGESPAEMQTHDSCCNLRGPEGRWHHGFPRAEASTKDVLSDRRDCESSRKDSATEDVRRSEGVRPPRSNTAESVLENVTGGHAQISGAAASEPRFASAIPVGQSYRGHVHYRCIPQEDTCMSHGGSGHKPSQPTHHCSDQSSEEEESFANPAHGPLRHHVAMGSTDQFLLLDISTKHAEVLVSYEHGIDREKKENASDTNGNSGTEVQNNGRERRNQATSVAGVDVGGVGAGTKPGAERFDEFGKKPWLREANVEGRRSVGREQRQSTAEAKNNAGVVEEREEGENQTRTWRVCSAPGVPESIQTSVSSALSICIPPTLPAASSPTDISAHLSTPVHHAFQCSLCERCFSQRGSLNRHVRSHLGVRPFPCPRCPMTFSRQYRVTEHMRVHQRCTLGGEFPRPPASSI